MFMDISYVKSWLMSRKKKEKTLQQKNFVSRIPHQTTKGE
jgi:hypothetical protein